MLNEQIAKKIKAKIISLIHQEIEIANAQKQIITVSGLKTKKNRFNPDNYELVKFNYLDKTVGYIILNKAAKKMAQIKPLISSIAELVLYQSLLIEQIPGEEERLDKFIYEVLCGTNQDRETILAKSKLFGIKLIDPKVIIVIHINDLTLLESHKNPVIEYEDTVSRYKSNIRRAFESFYTTNPEHTIAYLGKNHFCIIRSLAGSSVEENIASFKKTIRSFYQIVSSEIKQSCFMGVGNYYPGVEGLRHSYEEALSAIEIGSRTWNSEGVYHIDDFGVVAPLFAGINEYSINFSKELLKKIDQSEETMKTLEVYFNLDMNLTRTAEKLHIHRNTLIYRFDRITEILNLDPRNFEDAVRIKLAMLYPKLV